MGQSRPLFVYFCYFLDTISIIQIEKSVDGVLGTQTRGRRMVRADETTELWRPPIDNILFKIPDEICYTVGHGLRICIICARIRFLLTKMIEEIINPNPILNFRSVKNLTFTCDMLSAKPSMLPSPFFLTRTLILGRKSPVLFRNWTPKIPRNSCFFRSLDIQIYRQRKLPRNCSSLL